MDQPFLTPRSWMGRTSGRPRRKIKNISTVQAPMPRTETRRSTSSSSESFSACSRVGTTPSMDFCSGETGFAQDGLAEFEHFLRSGGAAGGAEGFDAAVDGGGGFAGDGLVGDGFEEGFIGG